MIDVDVDNLLQKFRSLVRDANETMNLVSRRDVDNLLARLIEESLLPLDWVACDLASPVLDIGAGAGFPGVPLKIARPNLQLTMLDSNRRKITFLKLVINRLQLKNTTAICRRAEDAAQDPSQQAAFRTVLSRGVTGHDKLLDWGSNLLQTGGELILWKGSDTRDGFRSLDLGGWQAPDCLTAANNLTLQRFVKKHDP